MRAASGVRRNRHVAHEISEKRQLAGQARRMVICVGKCNGEERRRDDCPKKAGVYRRPARVRPVWLQEGVSSAFSAGAAQCGTVHRKVREKPPTTRLSIARVTAAPAPRSAKFSEQQAAADTVLQAA
ncbi:unnamed protein product [Closterium sp. Yama58-4]|nr:unnamed protein product [Closterium sp. Yama58-4]